MKPMSEVAAEFDAIAAALEAEPRCEELSPAERALLRHVPARARLALDVGCGDGVLTRALARRGMRVLGIDASPGMIAVARERTAADLDVEYRVADLMAEPLADQAFDVVAAVALVHHLPLEQVVPRLAAAVAPGGVLLIQDVTQRRGLRHLPVNVLAGGWRLLRRVLARSASSPQLAALYGAHGKDEVYLSPEAVAPAYAALLPGASVHLHLEWRYTVAWRRPGGDPGAGSGR